MRSWIVWGAEVGDVLMFVSDVNEDVVFDALGHLRLHPGEKLGLIDHDKLDVLWVTEFPLLEYSAEENVLLQSIILSPCRWMRTYSIWILILAE